MKILVADDDPYSQNMLGEILIGWGYEVVAARNGNEAWHALQSDDAPRLALLDWLMPEMDGIEVCRKVRKERKEPYTYIILLSAQQREEHVVAGMEAGADDYITKPFKINELRVRLRAGRRIIDLQSELIAARQGFEEKASHDSLTGLWNHVEILDILKHELARADRAGKCVGAIMADLDFFKQVNDTYGHMAGDSVLSGTAKRILAVVRSSDFVGRYGGEEFLVILPDCNRECATAFAERIRLFMSNNGMNTPEGMIPITISLGVAVSCTERNRWDPGSLVKAADAALYQAKENGRNRVEVAPENEMRA